MQLDLSGVWRATIATDDLRRRYHLDDFDDAGWAEVTVPGHWAGIDGIGNSDGPVLHRRTVERPDGSEVGADDRWWIVFDGVIYQSDVWFDGTYLGDTEGYFAPHDFEITELWRTRHEHVLAVEATCRRIAPSAPRRQLTGLLQPGDDGEANPGGIWRPVRIERSGPVRIRSHRVLCTSADEGSATLAIEADLNLMFTQLPDGDLLLGDTHGRGTTIDPFCSEAWFELVLAEGARLLGVEGLAVRERWQGVYASAPEEFLVAEPMEGVTVASVTSGIGMTTGFGLAAEVADGW